MEAHHLVEERGGLVGGETQIGGSKLSHFSAPAQATERQRRIDAASDHQVQLRWQVVQQKSHALVDRRCRDQVVVVEHQHDMLRKGANLIEHPGQHCLDGKRLKRLQQREGVLAWIKLGPHGLERGDYVRPEERGLIVALIECEPCRGLFACLRSCKPFSQQRGLAEASWRGDEGQFARASLIQALDEPRTGYETWAWSGNKQ